MKIPDYYRQFQTDSKREEKPSGEIEAKSNREEIKKKPGSAKPKTSV